MNAVLSEKGQVTIPKKLRINLGLETGTILEFCEEDGKLVATKKTVESPFDEWVGVGKVPGDLSVDEYIDQVRDR